MPVTWCYDIEETQKYCNPGFPMGCFVSSDGRVKDACVISVSSLFLPVKVPGLDLQDLKNLDLQYLNHQKMVNTQRQTMVLKRYCHFMSDRKLWF